MLFVWDEPKRTANVAKHGLDFAEFEGGFDFAGAVELVATPGRDDRFRLRLVGVLHDRLVVAAILSPLGSETVSIISLRPASRAERRLYAQACP